MFKRVLLGAGPKTKLLIFIKHGESSYMGTLHFEDSDLCVRAYDLLAENVGRRLREIGDLEVPPDLSN